MLFDHNIYDDVVLFNHLIYCVVLSVRLDVLCFYQSFNWPGGTGADRDFWCFLVYCIHLPFYLFCVILIRNKYVTKNNQI